MRHRPFTTTTARIGASLAVLGCLWLPACDRVLGIPGQAVVVDGGAGADAGGDEPDAPPQVACDVWGFRPVHFDPCQFDPPPDDRLTIEGGGVFVYDTDARTLRREGSPTPVPHTSAVARDLAPDGIEIAILAAGELLLGAGTTLRVVGARPLLIASWSGILIEDTSLLDVSSRAGSAGAGAAGTAGGPLCASQRGAVPGADDVNGEAGEGGGGGGGGGGFGGEGGRGGEGAFDRATRSGGGRGGPAAEEVQLRAGCPGAAGGSTDEAGSAGGAGGHGGGAIHLAAQGEVTVRGRMHAGGAGGGGGMRRGGGGGGGAGGLISVEAPVVTIDTSAVIAANGGGGGGGADNAAGGAGEDGKLALGLAAGGSRDGGGGEGGRGGAGAATEGDKGQDGNDGGGGAGGGVGRIRVHVDGDPEIQGTPDISPGLDIRALDRP